VQLFTFMGRFVAKALLDNRLVDLPFSTAFYRAVLGQPLGLADLQELSPQVAASLAQLQQLADNAADDPQAGTLHGVPVSELGLDFTLPGEPGLELCPGGASRDVTIDNLDEYVSSVLGMVLRDGVKGQADAFAAGFTEVFPIRHLRAFTPEELDLLFNGSRDRWDKDSVIESLKFDHGYTRSSRAVGFLLEVMCEFSEMDRRMFLKFVTGSPRLPVGGLARLVPRLTIVQKRPEGGNSPDSYLPSVMTCANYLKLPDYSTKDVMRERLLTAIHEGQGCFLLS